MPIWVLLEQYTTVFTTAENVIAFRRAHPKPPWQLNQCLAHCSEPLILNR